MIALFFVPLLIVCAYSLLPRGPYGGVMGPWTLESYRRTFDRLYLADSVALCMAGRASTLICLVLGFPLALFIARSGRHKIAAAQSSHASVLD